MRQLTGIFVLLGTLMTSPFSHAELPTPSSGFRALGQINLGQGPMVIHYYGKLRHLRLELPPLGRSVAGGTVLLLNYYPGAESYVFPVGDGLAEDDQEFTPVTLADAQSLFPPLLFNPQGTATRRTGTRFIAGEPCDLMQIGIVDSQPVNPPLQACITFDGAMLELQRDGLTIFRALEFHRERLPEMLFMPPQNYQRDDNQSQLDNYRS
ncbi:hypothetical protein ACKC9G_16360 [Pokkaliibacter sp. CJK22405]|uniref:hypothetical protein n=1 Tax=Pokkaliibacter sp. CJK22405 TaxID=3384615 RepID=UPI0039855FDD